MPRITRLTGLATTLVVAATLLWGLAAGGASNGALASVLNQQQLQVGCTSTSTSFSAALTSAQEVPSNTTTATATASLTVDPTGTNVTVNITTTGIDPTTVSGFHIHSPAPPGTNAPITVDFLPAGTTFTLVFTNTRPLPAATLAAMLAGQAYLNIHTLPNFPNGQIRGQIACVPAGCSSTSTFFTANLTSSQEVPPNSTPATGTATIQLDSTGTRFSVVLQTSGLNLAQVTLAHIHSPAPPGVNASVTTDFFVPAIAPPGSFTNPYLINVPVANQGVQPQAVLDAMRTGLAYVNVHNQQFPAGVIRGQVACAAPPAPTPTATTVPTTFMTITGSVSGSISPANFVSVTIPFGRIPTGQSAIVQIQTVNGQQTITCPPAVASSDTTCSGNLTAAAVPFSSVNVLVGGQIVAAGTVFPATAAPIAVPTAVPTATTVPLLTTASIAAALAPVSPPYPVPLLPPPPPLMPPPPPGMMPPGVTQPGMMQPGMMQPGMAQPANGAAGMPGMAPAQPTATPTPMSSSSQAPSTSSGSAASSLGGSTTSSGGATTTITTSIVPPAPSTATSSDTAMPGAPPPADTAMPMPVAPPPADGAAGAPLPGDASSVPPASDVSSSVLPPAGAAGEPLPAVAEAP